jgi:hypothetical protein
VRVPRKPRRTLSAAAIFVYLEKLSVWCGCGVLQRGLPDALAGALQDDPMLCRHARRPRKPGCASCPAWRARKRAGDSACQRVLPNLG